MRRSNEDFFFLIASPFTKCIQVFLLNYILPLEAVSSLHGLDLTLEECPVTADT